MAPLIALEKVSQDAGGASLLSSIDLRLGAGMHALAGPSGAGKTTLLRLVMGLEPPREGTISLRGTRVSVARRVLVPPEERDVAMVFQDLGLWPQRTVEDHLLLVLAWRDFPRVERRDRARRMLAHLGLEQLADRRPGELSGGERQRVALARALVAEPSVLLLDEPLANLDVELKRRLIKLLRNLVRERDLCALYVTHEPSEARALLEHVEAPEDSDGAVIVIDNGHVFCAPNVEALADGTSTFGRSFSHGIDPHR